MYHQVAFRKADLRAVLMLSAAGCEVVHLKAACP